MRFARELGRLGLSVLVVAALAAPALADDIEGAKRAFMEGKKAYNLGEYDRAIDFYKEGYSLSPRPDFLYNIGQCYYQLKNWERAKFFYERYLSESPESGDAEEVRGIIRELDDRLAAGDTGSGRVSDPGPGKDAGWDSGDRPPDDRYGAPAPEPVAVSDVRVSKAFLIALALGYQRTSLCGFLGNGNDCFLTFIADFNFRVWNPRFLTLYVGATATVFSDFTESGFGFGGHARLRFDKWWIFVPYALAGLNVGYGRWGGGGTVRTWLRTGFGAELSLRNRETGRGVGLFAELGVGGGCCTAYVDQLGNSYRDPYTQYSITFGLSF